MKKIYALIAATGLVLSASVASAVDHSKKGSLEGNDTVFDNIQVSAYVAKYAAITEFSQVLTNDADGSAGSIISGKANFKVESNCNISISISDNDLAIDPTDPDTSIATTWTIDDTTGLSVNQDFEVDQGAKPHHANFSAALTSISSQASGTYGADLTVTVAAR